MTEVRAVFRKPLPPHGVIATVTPTSVSYGLQLDRESTGAMTIAQSDIVATGQPTDFDIGMLVTLERDDGLLPWAGWATQQMIKHGASEVSYQLKDWAGAIFSVARCGIWRQALELRAGRIAELVLGEAKERQRPPLLVDIAAEVEGPVVNYQARAEPVLDFLRTMSSAGLEWQIATRLLPNDIRVQLVLTERVGRDLSNEIIFEQVTAGGESGGAFVDAELTRDAEGYISSALVIGGTGEIGDRPAVEVSTSGLSDQNVSARPSGAAVADSPALGATRVIVEEALDNEDALFAVAQRQYATPEYVRELMTMSLFEGWLADNGYLQDLGVGSTYGVRFADLTFGLGYERRVRCIALDFDTSGTIRMTAEVLP